MSRKYTRYILTILSIIFVSVILLIMLTPTLLSTSWGTSLLTKMASQKINGQVLVKNLDLSWWGGQKADKVELKSLDGNTIISIDEVEAEGSLFSLISHPLNAGDMRIIGLKGMIIQDGHGVTNLEDILGLKTQSPDSLQTPVHLENVTMEIQDHQGHFVAKAVGLTRQRELKGQFSINVNLADKQTIQLSAQNFPMLVLDQTLAIQNPQLSGVLINLFGESIDLNIDEAGDEAQKSFQLLVKSPFISGNIRAELFENAIKLYSGSLVKFSIPEANADKLIEICAPGLPKPLEALSGQLAIEMLHIPLVKEYAEDLFGNIKLSLNSNKFKYDDINESLNLNSLVFSLDAPKGGQHFNINLEGEGTQAEKPLSVQLSLQVLKSVAITGSLKILSEEGIAFQGALKGLAAFEESLGANLQLAWKGTLKNSNSQLNLNIQSDKFSLPNIDLLIPSLPLEELIKTGTCCKQIDGNIALKNPSFIGVDENSMAHLDEIQIPWSLAPEGNVNFSFSGKRQDEEQIKGTLHIEQLVEQNYDISKIPLEIDLVLHNFETKNLHAFLPDNAINDVIGEKIEAKIAASRNLEGNINGYINLSSNDDAFLKSLAGNFELENASKDITFQAKTKQKLGSTELEGTFHNFFDENGKLNPDLTSFSLKGHFKHFPISIMTRALSGDIVLAQKAEAILGTQVDAEIFAEIQNKQGPIRAMLKGVNGQMKMEGKIESGALYLTEPLTASLKVTPQLDKVILREFIPLFGYVISSEKPLELSIAKENFRIPLRSPSLTNIEIGQATLQLNKMIFSRDSQIGKIVALLGVNANTFEVWFTPVYFSIEDGLLSMNRTDMLIANTYPMASWGTVDFESDELNMSIALSGKSLKKGFGVKEIKNSYMLAIPLRGPIAHPHIDTAQVATRISALMLQNNIGPEGKVLGTLVDVATGIMKSDKVPPATTNPLPWEDQLLDDKVSDGSAKEESSEKNFEQPFKELKKGAKSILKELLSK